MNSFATRVATVALTAVAALAPAATPALAQDFGVAGAPGLVHVVNAAGEERCEATVVAPKAVLATAGCVTDNDRVLNADAIKVIDGDTVADVSIVWAHRNAPETDLALITLKDELESQAVALDTFSLNVKHPALAANTEWVTSIVEALNAPEAETELAPSSELPTPVAPVVETPAPQAPVAVNPIRHFVRVER